MFKTLFLLFVFFFTLFLSGGEFRIAATADLHGNLRNLALLAPQIRRAAPDILVDAGDLTGGNLLAELDGGRSMIEALNLLKYDFRIPGNHDFDCPQSDFLRQCRDFKGVDLGGDWRWGSAAGVPWKIVTKGKFRVGIIGLTEPNISRRHLPLASGPQFRDWEQTLRRALADLRREKVHFIVLLWHNGLESRPYGVKNALRNIHGIDLVIASHSHKENPGSRFRRTYMVQPGPYALSAALVKVRYNDRTCRVEEIRSELLRGIPGKSAPDIAALNKRAVKPYYRKIFQKICRQGDLIPGNLARLGAEALRNAGRTRGAVFIFTVPGKYNSNSEYYKDLFRFMPYWNTLCTVELSRAELKMLLEDLHRNNRKYRRFMGVAGFRWQPGNRKRPALLEAPGRITLTVSSYLMVSSPVLRSALRKKALHWTHTGIVEREAVEKHLLEQRALRRR